MRHGGNGPRGNRPIKVGSLRLIASRENLG